MGAEVLDGKYALEELLGRGGMGEVFAGRNLVTGKRVAIKRVRDLPELKDEVQARFLREARAASVLEHANVVQVFDVGHADGSLYMVMELLKGQSLASYLASEGTIPGERAIALLLPILRALQHAHERDVIHRDLKPDNVFLCRIEGTEGVVPKLLDFGIAKIKHDPEMLKLTRTGAVMGTPYYMSPEQAQDSGTIDARSDVYAMGVIFYELLCGTRPYEGTSYASLMWAIMSARAVPLVERAPSIDPRLAACVERAMARDRDARYPSAAAFADALREAAGLAKGGSSAAIELPPVRSSIATAETLPSDPQAATPYSSVRPAPPEPRMSSAWWLAGVAALVAGGVGAVMIATSSDPEPTHAARTAERAEPTAMRESIPPIAMAETPAEAVEPARSVRVTTEPEGATVFVDGERRCVAPCEIALAGRAVRVTAERGGYEEAVAELAPPFEAELALRLVRLRTKRLEPVMETPMTEGLPFMDR
jgi:serine/threonine-protein kinase